MTHWNRWGESALLLALTGALLTVPLSGRATPVEPAGGAAAYSIDVPRADVRPVPDVPAVQRPNVLVIETDDMRVDDLRFMPSVRRLVGARGLEFTHSMTPNAICCPSRTSFLTSQYSHHHGVLSHVDPYGFGAFDDSRTLATRLQGHGYATGLVGKYLNGYGLQPVHGTLTDSLDYVPPGWDEWRAGSDKGVGGAHTYDYFDIALNVNGQVLGHPGRYAEDVLGENTREVIGNLSATRKPWFVWWTPISPHLGDPVEADDPGSTVSDNGREISWHTPGRAEDLEGRFDRQVPRAPGVRAGGRPSEARIGDRPRFLRSLPEQNAAERAAGTNVTRQRAEALAGVDRQVRRTIGMLRRTGQLERTVIVFTSDNGYYLGEHRIRQGKLLPYEEASRVPLLMAGPGIPRGVRHDPVTTMDLAETLVDLVGMSPTPDADGVSVLPTITEGDIGWRRPVVLEAYRWMAPGPGLFGTPLTISGVRTARWKYLRHGSGFTELYDLRADPLELTNLAGRDDVRATEAGLRRLWVRYRACEGAPCRVELDERWRSTPSELQAQARHEARERRAYYGG